MTSDSIKTGDIQGVGIAIGTGATVTIYGDIHYYPITLAAPLRALFAPLIADRVKLFAGRETLFAWIMDGARAQAGSYSVITAPAGFGKTAAIATLIHRTPQAFAYHFFTPLYDDALGEDFFLRNIVQQMAVWHGRTEAVPTDLNELRALYQQFLDTPLDCPQLLVLDGLDEVTTWRLAPYLSRRLPERLHFVLTLRDVGQDWRAEYQLPADQVRDLQFDGLDRATVAAVFRAAQGPNAAAARKIADDPQQLDELVRIATSQDDPALGADPFYVRLLAEDAAAGVLTVATIGSQPSGLDGYLERWWNDIKQRAGDAPTRDLFGTLAAALGPLSRTDLEAINASLVDNWANDIFTDVLRQVRRFVVGDDQRGYTLVHPRLRQYLRTTIKIASYDARLLDYCRCWPEHHSPYALRFLAHHLHNIGQKDELVATVRDLRYLARKLLLSNAHEVEADLNHAVAVAPQDTVLGLLQRTIANASHLFRACNKYEDLVATLMSRVMFLPSMHESILINVHLQPFLVPIRPTPDLPNPALLRTLTGHVGSVNCCAFSPNGAWLAAGSEDGTVRVWDVQTGALLRILTDHTDAVMSCAFSPDGIWLASVSLDGAVRLWDAHSAMHLHTLQVNTSRLMSCAFSPDGTWLAAGSEDGTVQLWDVRRGTLLLLLDGPRLWVTSCAFSPDGTWLAAGSEDGAVRMWDARNGPLSLAGQTRRLFLGGSGRTEHTEKDLPFWVTSCAFSPDGFRFASTSDELVQLWDVRIGKLLQTLRGHTYSVTSCAFSPDGAQLVTSSSDNTVRLWDTFTGELLRTLIGHAYSVTSCAFSPNGKWLASASDDETVRLWDTQIEPLVRPEGGHTDGVNGCAFSPDGAWFASASDDESVLLWDAGSSAQLRALWHEGQVWDCAFSQDGAWIASTSGDGGVRLWDTRRGKLFRSLTERARSSSAFFTSCMFSPDGSLLAAASYDKTVWMWDVQTGTLLRRLVGHTDIVSSCAFSTDGSSIASVSQDGTLRLWEVDSGALLRILDGQCRGLRSFAFSPKNGWLISVAEDGTLRLWDPGSGMSLHALEGHTKLMSSYAFGPNGAWLVSTTYDGTLRLWDATSGDCLRLLVLDDSLRSCAFSKDGQQLAVTGVKGIYWFRVVET